MTIGVKEVEAAARAIHNRWSKRPRVGVILGTGLGSLVERLDVEAALDYDVIPHFPRTTAPGHRGRWVCATAGGVPLVVMDGRFHAYEGHSAAQVAFPVRVMSALGIEILILSNACGGMNRNFQVGDVVVITDQVNLTWDNPLVGPHDLNPGNGFPDMSCPYDPHLAERALAIARRRGQASHRGVYVGVLGPHYETRAEYRFLRGIGGDAVGMSTVAEVITAAQCGLRVLGLSVVTNVCLPDRLQQTGGTQVLAAAVAAEPCVSEIICGVIAQEEFAQSP